MFLSSSSMADHENTMPWVRSLCCVRLPLPRLFLVISYCCRLLSVLPPARVFSCNANVTVNTTIHKYCKSRKTFLLTWSTAFWRALELLPTTASSSLSSVILLKSKKGCYWTCSQQVALQQGSDDEGQKVRNVTEEENTLLDAGCWDYTRFHTTVSTCYVCFMLLLHGITIMSLSYRNTGRHKKSVNVKNQTKGLAVTLHVCEITPLQIATIALCVSTPHRTMVSVQNITKS